MSSFLPLTRSVPQEVQWRLEEFWAKSPAKEQGHGEQLVAHTWRVVRRLADLANGRPQLSSQLRAPELWHCLFWSGVLHDTGKVARGFQDTMHRRAGAECSPLLWGEHRHEVLSLAFLDWISAGLSDTERLWILGAIVSHHLDAREILAKYNGIADSGRVVRLLAHVCEQDVRALWHWMAAISPDWIDATGLACFGVRAVPVVGEEVAVRMVCQEGVQRTRSWLDRYSEWVMELRAPQDQQLITALICLRGLLQTADHTASAHLLMVPRGVKRAWEDLARSCLPVTDLLKDTREYQRHSATGWQHSVILLAPTGTGKTEAALFWAVGDGTCWIPRIFYALPYQASMNAMYKRLAAPEVFGSHAVGLQHGRALQALYQHFSQEGQSSAAALRTALWKRSVARLHATPVKIFSPYQMLKTLYQLRGFESMLADYSHASFIFDEIHAYEPARLAVILRLVKHLREQYSARFLFMSATLPTIVRNAIAGALGTCEEIRASDDLFRSFQRHILTLLPGGLLEDGLPAIVADVRKGKSVLVCCNTVRRAQQVRSALRALLKEEASVYLLHNRLVQGHRLARERIVDRLCGVKAPRPDRPCVVVATQVIEVSLNLSLDTIYTDPAPLDALIQRFGRVNRLGDRPAVPVHVFLQPVNGQGVYWPCLVSKTLEVLSEQDRQPIDEAKVNTWLDKVYQDADILKQWQKEYRRSATQADMILRGMRPFSSDENLERAFEAFFDGVDVVPARFEQRYLTHLANGAFLEASNFLVSIRQDQWARLKSHGLLRPLQGEQEGPQVALLPYTSDGLHFDPSIIQEDEEDLF